MNINRILINNNWVLINKIKKKKMKKLTVSKKIKF